MGSHGPQPTALTGLYPVPRLRLRTAAHAGEMCLSYGRLASDFSHYRNTANRYPEKGPVLRPDYRSYRTTPRSTFANHGMKTANRLPTGSQILPFVPRLLPFFVSVAEGITERQASLRCGVRAARQGDTSPHLSPPACCGAGSARVCGVALGSGAQRSVSYASAPDLSRALQPRASPTPRDGAR